MIDTPSKLTGMAVRHVYDERDLAHYNDDSIVSRTLLNSSSGSVTMFAFAGGQALSEHTCPYDALAHVIDGEAEIIVGGASFRVKAGQMLLFPAHVPHALNAHEPFRMMLTMLKAKDRHEVGVPSQPTID